MKVEIDTAALADAVAWTSRVIDARPSNPILAGVKLEAIDGTLQFSAFNYEISARHHIEAGVDEAGSALVLGKLLADITKSLRSEKTYLTTDGSTLTITSGKSKFTLQLMPDAEYPDLPVVPPMLGQVDAQTFVQAVNQASVAVSREENRPVLTGVRMQFQDDKVIMTSTDRFRLARATFTWTPQDANVDAITLVRGSLLKDGLVLWTNTRTSALISMPITPRCSVLKMPVAYPLRSSSTVSSRLSTACSPMNT